MSSKVRSYLQARAATALHHRTRLFQLLGCAALVLSAAVASHAQFTPVRPATQVLDASALKPPAGVRVAIVEFDDLECPACAHANPLLKAAAAKYNIPWIRHDLLIPSHTWSRSAAIKARWFDTRSLALGGEYRDEVFANQPYIYNLDMLRQFTDKFAQNHGITMPAVVDPQGKFEAAVLADTDLGRRTGVHFTPTIFIVTSGSRGPAFVEVTNPDQNLNQIIEEALANTRPAAPPAKSTGKSTGKSTHP